MACVIDGSAIFWVIEWTTNSTIETIAVQMYEKVIEILFHEDVHLVFDRYRKYSIKSSTRSQRENYIGYRHKLTLQTVIPGKEKVHRV